jgi:uncharacterized protein (DUF2141 family)
LFERRCGASSERYAPPLPDRSASTATRADGTYALSLIHDENGNDRLDTTLAIPRKKGFGFSRNPTHRIRTAQIRFAAAFALKGSATQTVKMKYML